MSEINEQDETNNSGSTFSSSGFTETYLMSELRSHEEVNQRNLKATEDKIKKLFDVFNELLINKSSSILSEYKKQEEDLQQLDIRLAQKEKILRDLRDKEDSLKEELTSLKNKLKDLEHKHKDNQTAVHENTVHFKALQKAIKVYKSKLSMNLDVVASEGDLLLYRVSFENRPSCSIDIEINKSKQQIISFSCKGVPTTDEAVLKNNFNVHKNPTQLLLDFRNLIIKH